MTDFSLPRPLRAVSSNEDGSRWGCDFCGHSEARRREVVTHLAADCPYASGTYGPREISAAYRYLDGLGETARRL